MGCGAGLLNEQQRVEMFMLAAKEMMKLCVNDAMKHTNKIQVVAPGEPIQKAWKFGEYLKESSAEIKQICEDKTEAKVDKANDLAQDVKDKASNVTGMAGMLASAAATVGAVAVGAGGVVAEYTASGVGTVMEKTLSVAADGIFGAVNALDSPFKAIGQDIVDAKKDDIKRIYFNKIDGCRINNAPDVVRGCSPYGPVEYKAILESDSPARCCELLHSVCKDEILKELREIVEPEVKKHILINTWDKVIQNYNDANNKLGEYEYLARFKRDPIEFDMQEYIIGEVCKQFSDIMKICEKEARLKPSAFKEQTDIPKIFDHVFSDDPKYAYLKLTLEDYANMRRK